MKLVYNLKVRICHCFRIKDCGYFFRRKDLLKSKHRGLAISFFINIIILLLILSRPVVLLLSKIEIISMISSLTQIFSSTLPPLSSKSGKVLFSSTKLVVEQKYLFKTSNNYFWGLE